MTTTPLTDQQLADIKARADAVTPGPWSTARDAGYAEQYGETFVANWSGEYMRGVGDISLGVGQEAEADLAFVLGARTDVPALLAELGRVRAELATTEAQREAARAAWRRVKAGITASADLLDEPFTNAPNQSPWTRLKPAMHVLDDALKPTPPAAAVPSA